MSEDARYEPRFGVDIRVKPDGQQAPVTRRCETPGCAAEGAFRAPKTRDRLNDFYWFCVDHVRSYNLSWDYFRGMSSADIESYQRNAMTGHRPTWKMGDSITRTIKDHRLRSVFGAGDPFRIFDEGPQRQASDRPVERRVRSKLQTGALETLNLEASASWDDIKHRYKELVKRFHPDANGGDRSAEDRLKQVIKAYGQLRSSGFS
jgi:hypothetical protein